MKSLLTVFLLFLLFTSCSLKLSSSYYDKTLHEAFYVDNVKDSYTLHYNPSGISGVSLTDTPGNLRSDEKDSTLSLTNRRSRPFFQLLSAHDTILVANRQIDFRNVINFRDIGGLQTQDGKIIRWGKIFRSDNLSDLKTSEFYRFNDLHIQTVYDLRTQSEIKDKPDHLPGTTRYVHFSVLKDRGDLLSALRTKVLNGALTRQQSVDLTQELYEGSVGENLPAIRELIHRILESDEPVLYHCTAGKDRTGIVTALLLSILHVDRQTIMNEYLLSNYYRRPKIEKMLSRAKLAKLVKPHLDLTVIENFMKVDPQYLNATFAVIDQRYGGMEKFIQSELGFDAVSRQAIIGKFTYRP
jgi:protein-tyrosine phosphatase